MLRGWIALCSLSVASVAQGQGRSVRGIDVGGIKLGMTLAQVRAALPGEGRLEPMRSMDSQETGIVSASKARLRVAFFGGPSLKDPGRVISIVKDGKQTTCEAVQKAIFEKYGQVEPVVRPKPQAQVKFTVYGWFEEETPPPDRIPVVRCLQGGTEYAEYGCLWDRDVLQVRLTERAVEPGLCTYTVELHGGAYKAELEKGLQADAAVRQEQKFQKAKKKAASEKPSL